MQRIISGLTSSIRELRKLRTLSACAMLLALGVVLDYCSFYVTATLKISFSFIAIASSGFLFGAAPAMVVGGLLDVVMWLIKPAGAYFPGYTLSGILGGLIYGLCLYRTSGKTIFIMASISKLLVNVLVNILLNTYWSVIFTGKAYMVLLSTRIAKNLLLLPVEAALLCGILFFLSKNKKMFLRS